MRHIVTLFLIIVGTVKGFCQSEPLTISEQFDNTPIENVFKILKDKYALQIAYDYQDVAAITIDQDINNLSLDIALQKIFANTGLEHQLKNNRVLVRKISAAKDMPAYTIKTRTIKGKIIDQKTGNPLEFATIFSKADNQGMAVKEDGSFQIHIKTNDTQGELVIQHLGFVPRIYIWNDTQLDKSIRIQLQSKSHEFETVTVVERLPTISTSKTNGAITLHTNKLSTLPSFVGGTDLLRDIQLLPGISANDDLSAELRVRGSNGDENMIIFNGITLYKVDHFFGIFSAINSQMVDQVSVYKNAFPAQYGGRTASVVEFSSNKTVQKKLSGGLELNLLTSSAYLSVPVGDNMAFQFGGRLTNRNIASTDLFDVFNQEQRQPTRRNANNDPNPRGKTNVTRNEVVAYEPNFRFYDVNAQWAWQVNPTTQFSLNYFQGNDAFDYDYGQQYEAGDKNRRRKIITESYNESSEWLNRGVSGRIKKKWSNAFDSEVLVSYSGYEDNTNSISSIVQVQQRRNGDIVSGSEDTLILANNNFNDIKGTDVNVKNTWVVNEHQALIFGYNYVKNSLTVNLAVDDEFVLDQMPTAEQNALYGQYNWKLLNNKWQINVGLRGTHYSLTDQLYMSPRISSWYQVTDDFQVKGAWSRYNQFLRRNYYEDRFGNDREFWVLGDDMEFPVATSTNWMLGFNFSNSLFELDIEYYEKDTEDIIEYAQTTVGLQLDPRNTRSPYRVFEGNRFARGIDILLRKETKKYTGWIAYTLSKTTNSFDAIQQGDPYPSPDDRRHQLKWVNQYRWKQFDFSATYIYSSGRPYTDLSNFTEDMKDDRRNVRAEDRISYLESYQRIDVGVNYRFKWGISKGTVGLSIFNLLNRQNVKYRQYIYTVADPDPRPGQSRPRNAVLGTELQMLDRTPNISFSLEF